MEGKIVLITGASSGIGKETARALARQGATMVLAGRNLATTSAVAEQIRAETGNGRVEVLPLDLASCRSIRRFAAGFKEAYPRLDVLINNAGIFSMSRQETEDGFEETIGTNYLGPYLLTRLLLPSLAEADGARIVNVASETYRNGRIDLDDLHYRKRRYQGFPAYAASKLALVLFTLELAERLAGRGIAANALHPGHVATNIYRIWPEDRWYQSLLVYILTRSAISAEEGAQTSVYLASSDEVQGLTGKYFVKMEATELAPRARDARLRRELWRLSEELTGPDRV